MTLKNAHSTAPLNKHTIIGMYLINNNKVGATYLQNSKTADQWRQEVMLKGWKNTYSSVLGEQIHYEFEKSTDDHILSLTFKTYPSTDEYKKHISEYSKEWKFFTYENFKKMIFANPLPKKTVRFSSDKPTTIKPDYLFHPSTENNHKFVVSIIVGIAFVLVLLFLLMKWYAN